MTKWVPLLCLAFAAQARAGVRVESEVSINPTRSFDTVLQLQGDRFRVDLIDHATGEIQHSSIFDGERVVQLDGKDKTYTSMTMAELKAQMEQLDQKLGAPSTPPPVFTFARAPGGETLAGIHCDNYSMTKDGKYGGLVCLAPWKSSGLVTKAEFAPMRKLADLEKSFGGRSIGDITMGPDFEKWPGWPLGMAGPDGRRRTHVTKISRSTFPASTFEVPAGYTLKPLPMLGGAKGHAQ